MEGNNNVRLVVDGESNGALHNPAGIEHGEQRTRFLNSIPQWMMKCEEFAWVRDEAGTANPNLDDFQLFPVAANDTIVDTLMGIWCDEPTKLCNLYFVHPTRGRVFKLNTKNSENQIGETPHLILRDDEGPAAKFHPGHVYRSEDIFKKFKGRNPDLRPPQMEALNNLRRSLEYGDPKDHKRFMVILPTGVGKTRVMHLSPFVTNAEKVLVITPTVELASQTVTNFKDFVDNEMEKKSSQRISVQLYKWQHELETADIVVTNIQAIVQGKTVREPAKDFLLKFVPDLLIVDEGHHAEADSWDTLETILEDANEAHQKRLKTLLLTATPIRGDGQTFGLIRNPPHHYRFHRAEALKQNYIKDTMYLPIDVGATTRPEALTTEEEWGRVLTPAVRRLRELRTTVNGAPFRMLITVSETATAERVGTYFSRTFQGLRCSVLHARVDNAGRRRILHGFEKPKAERPDDASIEMVDVVVHCKMLGEGYDNPWISVSVFLDTPKSLSVLAQYHGRAIRFNNHGTLKNEYSPLKNQAILLYPAWPRMESLVTGYREYEDQTDEYLFAMPENFSDTHRTIARKSIQECEEFLRNDFRHYHDMYREARKGWQTIPAQYVADVILRRSGEIVRIIDFGCGKDAILEVEICNKLRMKDDLQLSTKQVEVVAVDVADATELILPQDTPEGFECTYQQGNYMNYPFHVATGNQRVSQRDSFDYAAFCLSIMAKDALPKALLAACRCLQPLGKIIIVVHESKFAFRDRTKVLPACDKFFKTLSAHGFLNPSMERIGDMIQMTIDVVDYTKDLDQLADEIADLTFKVKEETSEDQERQPKQPRMDATVEEEEEAL